MRPMIRARVVRVLDGWKIVVEEATGRDSGELRELPGQVGLVVVAAGMSDLGDGEKRRLEHPSGAVEANDPRGELWREPELVGEPSRKVLARPADRLRELRHGRHSRRSDEQLPRASQRRLQLVLDEESREDVVADGEAVVPAGCKLHALPQLGCRPPDVVLEL